MHTSLSTSQHSVMTHTVSESGGAGREVTTSILPAELCLSRAAAVDANDKSGISSRSLASTCVRMFDWFRFFFGFFFLNASRLHAAFFFPFMHGPFCTLRASLIQFTYYSVFAFLPLFSPVYDKFIAAETFTNSNYACLEIPRLITVCRAASYSCALWVIYYCTHKYISISIYIYTVYIYI